MILTTALQIFASIILPIFALIGIGAVADRCFRLDLPTLSRLCFHLFLPALIFVKILESTIDLAQMRAVVVATLAHLAVILPLALWVFGHRPFGDRRLVLGLGAAFFNCGNFGIPLAELAFPGLGAGIMAVILMTQNFVTFSLGRRRARVKESLSGRQRVRLALEHQSTDRIPIAMVCSGINPPARRALEAYLQRQRGLSIDAFLEPLLDIRPVAPGYCGPSLAPGEDIWSVRRKPVSYGPGVYDEIDFYPLAAIRHAGELDAHRWPSADWFAYDLLADRIAAARAASDPCLMVANGNIFETAWYMRGFEQMFVDFLLHPELAHAILSRVTDFYVEHFARMLTAGDGQIDLAFTADDLGGQQGLLMSLEMWEEFVKPHHLRLNQTIHALGARVIYHTDGAVMAAVPGLVDMGIDVLQALQFSAAGMDPVVLKDRYGDCLCFEGGVSVQTTLLTGGPDDVRQEVERLISVLGRDGGYILGLSHAIQAGTPPENVVALFDAALDYYPF